MEKENELHDFCKFIRELERKGLCMSQVRLEVDFTVAGVSQPLTVTPAQVPLSLTVGVDAGGTAVAQVSGGTAPYSYALDPASGTLPDGVAFAETEGMITLASPSIPTTAGSSVVLVNITDAAGAKTQVKAKTIIK